MRPPRRRETEYRSQEKCAGSRARMCQLGPWGRGAGKGRAGVGGGGPARNGGGGGAERGQEAGVVGGRAPARNRSWRGRASRDGSEPSGNAPMSSGNGR